MGIASLIVKGVIVAGKAIGGAVASEALAASVKGAKKITKNVVDNTTTKISDKINTSQTKALPAPEQSVTYSQKEITDHQAASVTGGQGIVHEQEHLSLDKQIETIRKLKELLDMGALTQEEFELEKMSVLKLDTTNQNINKNIQTTPTTFHSTEQLPVENFINVNVGNWVQHKIFGKGRIIFFDKVKNVIKVTFPSGEKVFHCPDCFEQGFLTID